MGTVGGMAYGDFVFDGKTWRLSLPDRCRNGHRFGPLKVSLTWRGCLCTPGHTGHTVSRCTECGDVQLSPECVES